jgi:hypothetical protein
MASTDHLGGYVGTAPKCTAFRFWTPHEAHHLAYAAGVLNQIIIAVRIFDIYAAAIPVSREPVRYFGNPADSTKLRFLAIDSVNRTTIDSTFAAERRRIATMMTARRRSPPFPDPLSPIAAPSPQETCQKS